MVVFVFFASRPDHTAGPTTTRDGVFRKWSAFGGSRRTVGMVTVACRDWIWFWCDSRLYISGVSLNPMSLYPPVELPVSASTPMLSSLVHWDHTDSWEVPTAAKFLALSCGGSGNGSSSSVKVDLSSPDSEDAYLTGHVIDGRVLFPATGYLVLAWQQLARMNGQTYQRTPVCFDDVHIHRATVFPSTGKPVCYYAVILGRPYGSTGGLLFCS